jgi:hypothetical protein
MDAAYISDPHSISRLHDDEISCVLPFLSLAELPQLVRCSHRFNAVARKERSRGLPHTSSAALVPSLVSSSLGHHVSSLHLRCREHADEPVTQETMGQLRALPQLTALQIVLPTHTHAAALLDELTPDTAVAALQSVLPTQLRSFSLESSVGAIEPLSDSTQLLFSSVLSAVVVMPQLTELDIRSRSYEMTLDARFGALAQLPQLRKLSVYGVEWTDDRSRSSSSSVHCASLTPISHPPDSSHSANHRIRCNSSAWTFVGSM